MPDNQPITRTPRGLDPLVAMELGDLLHELSHNKDTRRLLREAIKKAKPASVHANAFSDVDVDDKFESFKAEQEQKELERRQALVTRELAAQRNALLTGGADGEGRQYSEDDVKKIEALMAERGIGSYQDGATLYAATTPPVTASPGEQDLARMGGTTWEFPEFAKFGADPVRASREVAGQMIHEFMRKRR